MAWLAEQIREADEAGQTIAIYHYSPTEPANLRRMTMARREADALAWVTACDDGPDAQTAHVRLLRYNEDDTRALATVGAALLEEG